MKLQLRDSENRERADQPPTTVMPIVKLQQTLNAFMKAFSAFYDGVYIPDHSSPLNRWVHFLSNVAPLTFCALGLLLFDYYLLAIGIWCQLGPPYLGHILFEKSHRSIDQSPIFAAMGSWYTTYQIVIGKQSITHGKRPTRPTGQP